MADHSPGTAPTRRTVKPVGILFALAFLAVSSAAFTGDPWWLFTTVTIWAVAAAVALVGLVLLFGALPGRRRAR